MLKYYCIGSVFLFSFYNLVECFSDNLSNVADFDYLLFSQRWPITDCINWKDENAENNCSMPKNPNVFIVHGLWPTKSGTEGPNYCKHNPKYDPNTLDPIIDDMINRWTNIQGGTPSDSFWSHEWIKHGTCAMILPQFDSEFNYFKHTLDLNLKYDIGNALKEYGVLPGLQKFAVDDFLNAVVRKYGKIPQIHCTMNSKKELLLSEIRICFNRSLALIDCTSVGMNPRNCYGKNSILYLNKLPDI